MPNFTWEFHNGGGYDCMSDAVYIVRGCELLAVLDMTSFGATRANNYQTLSEGRAEAERLATIMVNALNAQEHS